MSNQSKLLPSSEIPDGPVVELNQPPKDGSAVMRPLASTAAAAATSASVATARTLIESGSMGLSGIWRVVGNVTAVAFVCGMFFLIFQNWTQTQKAMLDYERVERQKDREERSRDRDAANSELRALTTEIRTDRVETRQLLGEIRTLVQTMRLNATRKE
jgi:hypothetical protein